MLSWLLLSNELMLSSNSLLYPGILFLRGCSQFRARCHLHDVRSAPCEAHHLHLSPENFICHFVTEHPEVSLWFGAIGLSKQLSVTRSHHHVPTHPHCYITDEDAEHRPLLRSLWNPPSHSSSAHWPPQSGLCGFCLKTTEVFSWLLTPLNIFWWRILSEPLGNQYLYIH